MRYKLTKHITDWVFNDNIDHLAQENVISLRNYREEEFQWSKKSVLVPISTTSDVVVYSVTNLKAKDAKEEMKDKKTTTEFTLPDCLPAMPDAILKQAQKLVLKKFREN